MTKHRKTKKPTDKDLENNPLIGASKGTAIAGVTPDELEASKGVNTIEGDVENDTNAQGGIDKPIRRVGRPGRAQERKGPPRRKKVLQGKKTHEQQLRILQRKPDIPDDREMKAIERAAKNDKTHSPKRDARQSEFTVSR